VEKNMKKKAATTTPAKKTLLAFIQDRSGSMSGVWQETLNGFKKYVEDMQADQKKDNEIEYIFSLTTFDTQIENPYLGVPIASVDGGKLKEFGPRGSTALYDAVGKTLQALDDDKSITFDKAIVIICTDGEENSSREYSKDALHAAIDDRIKRGNWTFTYLGTQPETWAAASSLGIGVGASAVYNAQNAQATYTMMAYASAQGARSAPGQSVSFLHDNTTPLMRCSVGMKTEDDDAVPVGAGSFGLGGGGSKITGGSGLGSSFRPTVKPRTPPPIRHVPRPQSPESGRKWK
jgi:uncharacterized protein YegL